MAMRQVEIQARSVEEAVRLALEQMGRTREQVDVQVLAGTETGSEDDEVLVRVTAREQLSRRARTASYGAGAANPRRAASTARRPSPPAPATASAPRTGRPAARSPIARRASIAARAPDRGDRGPRPDRGDRFDRGPRAEAFDQPYGAAPSHRPPARSSIDAALSRAERCRRGQLRHSRRRRGARRRRDLQHLLVGMRFRGRIARPEPEAEAGINFGDDDPSVVLNITGLERAGPAGSGRAARREPDRPAVHGQPAAGRQDRPLGARRGRRGRLPREARAKP